MTHSRLWRFVVVCWLLAPASALAQEAKVRAIDVNLFRPSPSRYALFTTELTQTADPWSYTLGFTYDYQKDPLVLRSFGRRIDGVVTDQQTMNLLFSIGLPYRLEVGLDIPIVTRMDGSGGRNLGIGVGPLETAAFGDIRLTPKIQVLKTKGFGLGFAGTIALPTGRLTSFHGERSINFMPKLLLDYEYWRLAFTGLAGYVFRNRAEFSDLVVGDEIVWAVGAKLRILETVQGTAKADRLAVIGELYGRSNGNDPFNKFNENPMVAVLGARYLFARYNLHVTAGVARGLQGGYGAPAIQPFIGVMWAPVEPDSDGDGVPDNRDRCPGLAGKAEWQGCPDTDGDGLPDHEDACPDLQGPRDNKGCPYIDTDKDGIPDKDDKCPTVPGPSENQGCPYPDADQDGIPDKDDDCPQQAGPATNKGCPLRAVVVTKTEVRIRDQIFFRFNSATILPKSFQILNEVAETLRAFRNIREVEVQGHTDDVGGRRFNLRLSQKRAEAVRRYLAGKGVSPKRLVAKGYGEERPVRPVDRRRMSKAELREARALNRRVQFLIVRQ